MTLYIHDEVNPTMKSTVTIQSISVFTIFVEERVPNIFQILHKVLLAPPYLKGVESIASAAIIYSSSTTSER